MRRLATLLALAVGLTTSIACPRGGLCCAGPEREAAPHDCCQKSRAAIGAFDCCPDGPQLTHRAVNSHGSHGLLTLAAAALSIGGTREGTSRAPQSRSALIRGPAPPGTLTAQHVSLLL